jgi:hypothetical protein
MANRYWVLGTGTWSSTNTANWSASSGGAGGASVPTAADNVFFDANSNVLATAFTVIMQNTPRVCNDFTASGLDGVMTLAGTSIGLTVSGSLTFQATNFTRTYTGTTTFAATTTGKTITTNGVAFGGAVTFNGVGGGWTLGSALTVPATSTTTLTNGTLDLGNFTLSTGIFSSDNANTRAIAFGTTGSIVPTTTTAATTVLAMATATNFTFTGTSNITAAMSVTRTFNFGGTAGATTSNRLNVNTTSGASIPTFTGSFRQINFTGSTTSFGFPTISCHGFTLASGGTYTNVNITTVGDGNLTYTGKAISTLTINGTGITTTLNSAGTNGNLILTNGTIDLAGYTLTTPVQTSAGTKNITFNGGTLLIASGNFANSNPTGFTTTAGTGTGVISMTSASTKTMTGSSTYNCTLNQGGAGNLNITGSNTFNNITNTVQPASIIFTAGTTNTFNNFSLSGTAGNLITIGSATAASHTLSKASGTVSADFLSISRSTATGGAIWDAGANSTDGGNNSGWIFTAPPAPSGSNSNFLVFF